jgi:hypothetical protein
MSWGNAESVKIRLSVDEGETPEDNLIDEALKTANAQIEGRLKKHLLKITGSNPILDEVANYYASAEALVPKYDNTDDENQKAKYWNSRADALLDEYIEGAIKEQNNNRLNDNPYSVSTTNEGSTYGEILRD